MAAEETNLYRDEDTIFPTVDPKGNSIPERPDTGPLMVSLAHRRIDLSYADRLELILDDLRDYFVQKNDSRDNSIARYDKAIAQVTAVRNTNPAYLESFGKMLCEIALIYEMAWGMFRKSEEGQGNSPSWFDDFVSHAKIRLNPDDPNSEEVEATKYFEDRFLGAWLTNLPEAVDPEFLLPVITAAIDYDESYIIDLVNEFGFSNSKLLRLVDNLACNGPYFDVQIIVDLCAGRDAASNVFAKLMGKLEFFHDILVEEILVSFFAKLNHGNDDEKKEDERKLRGLDSEGKQRVFKQFKEKLERGGKYEA